MPNALVARRLLTSPAPSVVNRFGALEDVALHEAGQLRKNGLRVQEQPFRVLALLLDKPGRVVTREELQEKVWPDTHVDFEHSLNTAVNKIREALGDSASSPRFVETLPGRGYKFLATVEGTGTDSQRSLADSSPPKAGLQRTIHRLRVALIALAAVFAITAIMLVFIPESGEVSRTTSPRRYSITPAGPLSRSHWPSVAVSPDGRHIAYVAPSDQNGESLSLWVHDLTKDLAREITPAGDSASPFWSPDSRFLAFKEGDELKRVSIAGGSPITVCRLDGLRKGTWGPGGASITVQAGGQTGALNLAKLYEVAAGGGEPKLLAGGDGKGFTDPHFLPSSRYLLYTAVNPRYDPRIMLRNLDNGQETELTAGVYPVYSPSGHILYQSGWTREAIWALPFSLRDLEPMGEPFLVAEGARFPSPAFDGTLVYLEPSRAGSQRLVWRDRQGRKVGEIGQPQKEIFLPSLSPDGRYVGVEGVEERTGADVWLQEVERPIKTRLTFDAAWDSRSIWSPDSQRVAFCSNRNGGIDLFIKPIDGSEEAEAVLTSPSLEFPEAWSPGGEHLLLAYPPGTILSLARQRDGTWAEPVPYSESGFVEDAAQFSPGGRFVAYCSNESGRGEVYVRPFPPGRGKWKVSQDGGEQPRWSRDGQELFYVKKDTLYVVLVSTEPAFTQGASTKLFTSPDLEWPFPSPTYDVSLDGQRFVTVETIGEAPPARIRIVQNWFEEFRDGRAQ